MCIRDSMYIPIHLRTHQTYYTHTVKGLYGNKKRKIETKYRLPLLNWSAIPATQISGTVFDQLDDERVLKSIDFTDFEEVFKLKSQADIRRSTQGSKSEPMTKKSVTESLLDPTRSQNVAIAKKKVTISTEELKQAITTYVCSAYTIINCGICHC